MDKAPCEFGKVGVVLPGGGCKYVDQLFRLRHVLRYLEDRNVPVRHVTSNSAGCFTAYGMLASPTPVEGIERSIRISKEKLYAYKHIFRLHPCIEKKVADLPHWPWGYPHASFRDLFGDCVRQAYNLFAVIGFLIRLPLFAASVMRDVGKSSFFDPALSDGNKKAITQIAEYIISDFKGIFDLQPLRRVLMQEIGDADVQCMMEGSTTWHLLARRIEDGRRAVFSPQRYRGMEFFAAKERVFEDMACSCALFPLLEVGAREEGGLRAHYLDYDPEDPLPIDDALDAGCDTIFAFPTVSGAHLPSPGSVFLNQPSLWTILQSLLGLYATVNHSLMRARINDARRRARRDPGGKNIFIVPPVPYHPDIDLLSTSPAAISYHEEKEAAAMELYLADLRSHNLRYASE